MKFKKYITLGVTLLSITSTLVGCSSKDVKVNKEIQGALESKIEESIGECKVEFGDSNVCGYEFKGYDNYDEVLFVNITLKDRSLGSLSKDELKKYGRNLYFSKLHKPIHILYDKYMSNKNSYLYVQVEDSKDRVVTADGIDNTYSTYYKSNECPVCNLSQENEVVEPRGGFGYCSLCNEGYSQEDLTSTHLSSGEKVIVCPNCLDDINSGIYDNVDLENAN